MKLHGKSSTNARQPQESRFSLWLRTSQEVRKPKHFKVWIGLSAWLLGSSLALAQEVSVTAEIDPNPVGLSDQLTLTLKVSGPAGSTENPQIPGIEGLRLVAGPSISRSFQWINGQASSSQSFSYVFEPQKEGTLQIPPLHVRIGGKDYQT